MSPFGIPNEKPEQTKWVEDCVASVMEDKPKYPQGRAVAICKAQLKKNNWKVPKESDSELSMREELFELEKKIRDAIESPVFDKQPQDGSVWVADVFDDYIVIEKGRNLYKVGWSISNGDINISWDSLVEVERKVVYEPISSAMKIPRLDKPKHRRITLGNITIN